MSISTERDWMRIEASECTYLVRHLDCATAMIIYNHLRWSSLYPAEVTITLQFLTKNEMIVMDTEKVSADHYTSDTQMLRTIESIVNTYIARTEDQLLAMLMEVML